ncbi:hypothetical protein BDZ94DRAFT_1174146 [Collybia nuda]|uniref:Glycosyltransferase 61 catalytic domain-containing protein n=1 Tax=Collybia nuda TaxID=64659 RepID=A0A9P5XW46_9AGAR|nr:hypothetical protein BDZ94DRAFT_1174146 [Collybia nuda]
MGTNGFTMLDNLYLRNGVFYIVTPEPSSFPPTRYIISRPVDMGPDANLEPTDRELQFLDPQEVQGVLGESHMRIDDLSVIIYDPPQFLTHFYHWWGEIILGVWRIYSVLSTNVTSLPPPARFLIPFSHNGEWRDRAGVNGPLMRAAFPHTSIEQSEYWEDLIKLNITVVFERVVLVNRHAAHTHNYANQWYKMIAGTMNVTVPDGFWAPIQKSLVQNILGYLPAVEDRGVGMNPLEAVSMKPLVTYISRQAAGRRLLEKDHEGLVGALRKLEEEGICDVQVAMMERMTVRDQIDLVARSTIILGVHGNGLTHQLWMPPSSRSTIIEIFSPEGFLFDYEILARNLGHRHYIVWNDTLLTYPKGTYHKGINYVEEFHGTTIPVHGPSVARVIKKLLADHTS